MEHCGKFRKNTTPNGQIRATLGCPHEHYPKRRFLDLLGGLLRGLPTHQQRLLHNEPPKTVCHKYDWTLQRLLIRPVDDEVSDMGIVTASQV